jgi:hypothetical protein
MKNLKIKLIVMSGLFLSFLFNSCETENSDTMEQTTESEFLNFKTAFPDLESKINYTYIQKTSSNSNASPKGNLEGVTFPVTNNEEVIGRYIGTADEISAIYIDFSDYKNKITVYDVNDPSKSENFIMILDEATNIYSPEINSDSGKGFWCDAQCTIAAIAIAASDGPSPLMDILAISFQITCLAACRE